MKLEAKETRMVVLALRMMLQDTIIKMQNLSDEEDEHVFLASDAMLLDTMIRGFENEYRERFSASLSQQNQ